MSKELFIAAHERLVADYLDRHPKASFNQAYEATADRAYTQIREDLADLADHEKQRLKDEGNWPPKE